MRNSTLHTLSLNIFQLEALPSFWALIDACSASLVNLELDHKYCGALFKKIRDLMRSLISSCRPSMEQYICFPRAPTSPLGPHHFPLSRADVDVYILPPFVRVF